MSHAAFVHRSLTGLAEEIFAGIDSSIGGKFRVMPADNDSGHHWVEKMFAPFVKQKDSETAVLRYRVSEAGFSLVKKTRRRFLGRFWVMRELRIGLTITYPPGRHIAGDQSVDFVRTYNDWVRAADLDQLAGDEFSSLTVPPASDFVSRWAAPVVVGAGLGILTYLFFSVR